MRSINPPSPDPSVTSAVAPGALVFRGDSSVTAHGGNFLHWGCGRPAVSTHDLVAASAESLHTAIPNGFYPAVVRTPRPTMGSRCRVVKTIRWPRTITAGGIPNRWARLLRLLPLHTQRRAIRRRTAPQHPSTRRGLTADWRLGRRVRSGSTMSTAALLARRRKFRAPPLE
jgi:hypothetical protein